MSSEDSEYEPGISCLFSNTFMGHVREVLSSKMLWMSYRLLCEMQYRHTLDDEEIKLALKREDSILQSENAELSRQIEAIEGENHTYTVFVCLLKQYLPFEF